MACLNCKQLLMKDKTGILTSGSLQISSLFVPPTLVKNPCNASKQLNISMFLSQIIDDFSHGMASFNSDICLNKWDGIIVRINEICISDIFQIKKSK